MQQATPSKPPLATAAGCRRVLSVLAVRHALGLAAEVRRVLQEAADGDVDRARIRKLARGLTRTPGPPTYLLYAAAFLTLPPPPASNGAILRAALGPLMLREAFTALALVLDVLQLLGVSSEAPSGGEQGHKAIGPRRPMPASLSTVSLALEVRLRYVAWRGGTKRPIVSRRSIRACCCIKRTCIPSIHPPIHRSIHKTTHPQNRRRWASRSWCRCCGTGTRAAGSCGGWRPRCSTPTFSTTARGISQASRC
jgi:hypothetical protein